MAHATRKTISKTRASARKSAEGRGSGLARFVPSFLRRIPVRRLIRAVVVVALLVWGVAVFVAGDGHQKTLDAAQTGFYSVTAKNGFAVRDVLIEGRERLDLQWLQKRLDGVRGMSVFAVDIALIKNDLERQNWVASAAVQRLLPDRIKITLVERVPFVFLTEAQPSTKNDTNHLRAALMDDTATRIGRYDRAAFPDLLLVEGKGAVIAAKKFLPLLAAEEALKARVERCVYVGERRWDLILNGGLRIKLPEDDAGYALRRLMKAQEEDGLLNKPLKSIDLRQVGRIILETRPEQAGSKAEVKEFSSKAEGDNI